MIKLWDDDKIPYQDFDFCPILTEYAVKNPKSCFVVCPGGGYGFRSDYEGHDVALWLNSLGIYAFVLDYRVAPYKHPAPISDVARAVRYARFNAGKYGYANDKIGVIGFSAGGHLAASLAVHSDKQMYEPIDELDNVSARLNAIILAYPVINFGEYRHDGSRCNLIGENPSEDLIEFMSLEKQVTTNTPQTFIWHTANDAVVPVENSLMFAKALRKNKVPFEMHIYPDGNHGLGLAKDHKHVSQWTSSCSKWLENISFA